MSYSLCSSDIPHPVLHLHPEPHCAVRPEGPSLTFGHETDSLTSAVSSVATSGTNDRAHAPDLPWGIPHLQPPILNVAHSRPTSMMTVPRPGVVQSSAIYGPTQTVRPSCCDQTNEDRILFATMLKHTALEGVINEVEWTKRFGKVSQADRFGCNIWSGMYDELGSWYLPAKGLWWTKKEDFASAWFELPRIFSKDNASLPKDTTLNPGSGRFFPCMASRPGQLDNTSGVTMICIHILVKRSAAWSVDVSWLIW